MSNYFTTLGIAHTIEMGETSSGRVISRINDYLHFLLGNGLCLDVFTEYKSSVCTLMEKLIRKYSDQQHKTLRDPGMLPISETKVYFDQYDFYCLVRFFNASEIERVFRTNNCKLIEFENMDWVESAIHNLLIYSEKMLKETKTPVELNSILSEVDTCLTLSRYMNISEKMIENICHFIFKYNLGNITIDQKIKFLDYHVYFRHITNDKIKKILEDVLIRYIDERLKAIHEGRQWESFSKVSGINYPNISDYLDIEKKGSVSRRLSKRVSIIIDNQVDQMQKEAVENYSEHISRAQKKRLCEWIENQLQKNFEFKRFSLLMQIDAKRAKSFSDRLYLYIKKIEEQAVGIDNTGIDFYPKASPHWELLNVGFWCFCGFLDSKKFISFKGIDLEYDFLIDAISFDYSQFNVCWLLRMNKYELNIVTNKAAVRKKVLKCILQEIKKNELKQDEKENLVNILGEYFAN